MQDRTRSDRPRRGYGGNRFGLGAVLMRFVAVIAAGLLLMGIWQAQGPSMTAVPSTTTFATTHVCGSQVCR